MPRKSKRADLDYTGALLGHLLGVEVSGDPPPFEKVPPNLMRPLVEAMALHLTTHRGHLSSTVPPILRPFINFSKKTLLADHQAKVLEGVWKGRSFRCVDETVKSWIDVNPDVRA